MTEPEIMKVQCDATGTKVLIYNEDKSNRFEVDGEFAKIITTYFELNRLDKCYAMIHQDKQGRLVLNEEVETQDW